MLLSRTGLCGCIAALLSLVPLIHGAVVFNFDTDPAGGFETTPFTNTVSGLSAVFGGEASVCFVGSPGVFVSLSGNVLIQDLCNGLSGQSGPLTVSFSSDLANVSLDFATATTEPLPLTLSAFEDNIPVGSSTFESVPPRPDSNGEGVASFTGDFNSIVLSSTQAIAIDNVTATPVPEPSDFGPLLGGFVWLGLTLRRLTLSKRGPETANPGIL